MLRKIVAVWVSLAMMFGIIVIVDVITDITPTIRATTLYVNETGSGGAYTSIQDAINDSDDGDTVFVYNGTYYENVVVDKTINLIGENRDTTIIDGGGSGNVVTIIANWVNFTGFNVTGCGLGGIDAGISFNNVQNCLVFACDIFSNNMYGLSLSSSSNNNVTGNNVLNNEGGIYLFYSNKNNISDNSLSSNDGPGISLYSSSENIITANSMTEAGIQISGNLLEYWNTHNIDTSNTVNGKPIYYWRNQTGETVPPGAGQVILANCTNVIVENQEITDCFDGILIGFSSNNNFIANNVSNNRFGIYFYYSSENTIIGNTVTSNNKGIYLYSSIGNNITDNIASSNAYGINCDFSSPTIAHNNISSNTHDGIELVGSHATVTNNYLSNNEIGIFIQSSNPYIANNTVVNNWAGIYFNGPTAGITINNTIKDNTNRGVWTSGSANPVIVNSTIKNNGYDFYAWGAFPITLNTTFDDTKINLKSGSTLTVKNYLHILVLDATSTPIPGVDIKVTDNGIRIYQTPGFGGKDPQTDGDGFVRWIVVTDRIYIGSNTVTKNLTTAEVSYPPKSFIDNPRDVNTYTSHTEIFIEIGGVLLPDLVLTTDDIAFTPPSPVIDKTLVTINATIRNIGAGGGFNVVVRFYDGTPPANLIGEAQIPLIAAFGGVGWAEVEWIATPVGTHNIYVVVDPDDIIVESNETNNIASKGLEVMDILPPTLYIEAVGDDIVLNWTEPGTTGLSHYLLYRSTSQTGFDFSDVWIDTSQHDDNGIIPLRTTWNDTGAASDTAPQEYYYTIRTVSKLGEISSTSRTVGKYTKIFLVGISTFSLPLEPLHTMWTDNYITDMNADYIKYMNTTTHIWMQHNLGDGNTNNTQMKLGEGFEVKFATETTYTFTGTPGAIIMYDDNIQFLGFDPANEGKNLTVAVEPNGDVNLTWEEPLSMGVGDWYEVYNSSIRDGFFGTFDVDYFLVQHVDFGTNTATHNGALANEPGARLYYMVVPFNGKGIRGTSTYSIGIWTEEYLSQYDTFGMPLKLSNNQTADWYCDNIPDTVGINYFNVSTQRWRWHSTRMSEGAYDPILAMTEGYQISTSSATKFTFIGI